MSAIESTVGTWPGIDVEPHDRGGGREFTLDGREIGHLHDSGLLDIPFARRVRDVLVEEGRAGKHHVYPESSWTSYRIRSDEEVKGALWLLRVSYLSHLIALRTREGSDPETDAIDIDEELATLGVSDELTQVFDDLRGAR